MIRKLGIPALALAAMLFFIPTPQAKAGVHFGVAIGGPAYVAPAPVYPPYVAPAPGYYAPYPAYTYPVPTYVYPYADLGFGWGGGWLGHGYAGHYAYHGGFGHGGFARGAGPAQRPAAPSPSERKHLEPPHGRLPRGVPCGARTPSARARRGPQIHPKPRRRPGLAPSTVACFLSGPSKTSS